MTEPTPPGPRWLSRAQVARLLYCSGERVTTLRKEGRLRFQVTALGYLYERSSVDALRKERGIDTLERRLAKKDTVSERKRLWRKKTEAPENTTQETQVDPAPKDAPPPIVPGDATQSQ